MSQQSLMYQLQAISDSLKQTLNLIQELQRFPHSATFTTSTDNPDEKRVEIANDIHQNLKEQEDALELLKQEVDDFAASDTRTARRYSSARGGEEQARNSATLSRLSEDIKSARVTFRRAQLQAKRNADAAKRKEREQLFADRLGDSEGGARPPSRRKGQEKLTQDELALNAAEDVTRSLQRAHELLSGNLQQSQFAQQTLDESSTALKDLSDSYGGTGDLLKSSRGLVNLLLKTQKSDTWFLISSAYILAATIAWLIFRRLLYGPLWWLVYQPLKLMWWFTLTSLGTVGFPGGGGGSPGSTSLSTLGEQPTRASSMPARSMGLPAKGAGWGGPANPPPQSPEMVEKVSQIIENTEEGSVPSGQARNTKKRMMELENEGGSAVLRDEL